VQTKHAIVEFAHPMLQTLVAKGRLLLVYWDDMPFHEAKLFKPAAIDKYFAQVREGCVSMHTCIIIIETIVLWLSGS
jgi:hypothetical protein